MNLGRARALLALAATALVLALLVALAPTAHGAAGSAGAPVTGGSWFWADQIPPIDVSGGQPGQPAGNPTPPDVPTGDFAVAAKAGQPDKVTALHIDTSAIPTGSTISSFTLTLTQDDTNAHSVGGATGSIKAYPATDFFADGSEARPIAEAPAYQTTGPTAAGILSGTGTWTFDIKDIVSSWVSGSVANNGIVLAPSGDAGQSFEVVWNGAQPPPVTDGSFTPAAGSTDSGGLSGGGGSTDLGSSGGGASATGGSSTPISPDFTTPISAPTSTGTPAAPPAVRQRSVALRGIGKVKRAPPWPFYLAVLAGILLVAGSMVSLGEAGEPVVERRGSVMRTLERRNPSSL